MEEFVTISKKTELFDEYKKVLNEITQEIENVQNGFCKSGTSAQWTTEQLHCIENEIKQLNRYAQNNVVYFAYGKRQRVLKSSYIITDSLNNISSTSLGTLLCRLQEIYDKL